MNNELLKQDYFELFGLALDYQIDLGGLQNKLRALQKQYHPDNFAAEDTEVINQALVISSQINQAYTTLSEPLARAIYLLQLHGVIVDLVHGTKFSNEFLMAQIELREQISEAEDSGDFDALEQIEQNLQNESTIITAKIGELFIIANYAEISELVKQLAFYKKLEQLVANILGSM
ncbi:MAG: Fe-S protein assembly co-chaperone HscB [Burkholderiales bacterium]|nr:Fe-S protein assembly co-chaperone HscB [Burkholderiales bacterium]